MPKRNYYENMPADYSRPGLVSPEMQTKLIEKSQELSARIEPVMPQIGPDYTMSQIEAENRDWWCSHPEALREGRFDLLEREYRDEFVYLCQDGPFYGKHEGAREAHWVAIITQPGVTMCWPIVMFAGETIYFEWQCLDETTFETVAKGNVTYLRRGHRGGIYLKTEQLTFYRDVYAPAPLLERIVHPEPANA